MVHGSEEPLKSVFCDRYKLATTCMLMKHRQQKHLSISFSDKFEQFFFLSEFINWIVTLLLGVELESAKSPKTMIFNIAAQPLRVETNGFSMVLQTINRH